MNIKTIKEKVAQNNPATATVVKVGVFSRRAKNIEEGKGFKVFDTKRKNIMGGGAFQFANSNELWRASLDVIDFMPLSSVNYSGGIIITCLLYTSPSPRDEEEWGIPA